MKNILTLTLALFLANCIGAQTFEQGKAEYQNENYRRAKKTLVQVVKTDQLQPSLAHLYLGNAYLQIDEQDSALMVFRKVAEGTDAYSFIAKAKIALIEKNDVQDAKANLEKAVNMSRKKDAEVYFQAGYACFIPKPVNVPIFISYLEEARTLAPGNLFYALALGDAFQAWPPDGGGKAMTIFEEVTAKNPDNALGYVRMGRLWYSSNNYPAAMSNLEKSIALNPNIPVVHKELGELYYLDKQYVKAKEEFKKYIDLNDNDPKAKSIYLGFLYQLKDYQKAVEEINAYVKTDSTNYVFYRLMAYCNYELKQPKIAQTGMNQFWKYAGKNKVTSLDYTYAGKIALANNDTLNAINCMRNATEIDSTNADLQSEFGVMLFNLKRYNEAISQYNKRIVMTQKAPSPLDYYYLGRAYFTVKDYKNADTTFAKYVQSQPKSPDGYLWRGKSIFEMEDKVNFKGLAAPNYLKFIELGVNDMARHKNNLITAYNYMAILSLTEKNNEQARLYFGKVLELDPSNKFAQDELKKLK